MRMKRLAAFVTVCVCLATVPASASDWNAGNGLWGNGANWLPAGVPTATNANIANGGSATLQTAVPNITTLDLTGGSDLTINAGADLTTTGNAVIATGAFNDGYVSQGGGTMSLGADLILGNGADTYGEWIMSNGSVEVTNNLTIGNGGDGVFSMSDGGLTVHGGITIADSSGLGTLTVSGGTLLQDGVAGSLSVGGGGAGTLRVEGDTPTINVTDYEQTATGALDVEFNDFGIATIYASGDVNLNGALGATVAGGASLTTGVYDLIVMDGTRTGEFNSLTLDYTMSVEYELNGDGKEAVRLYVDTDAPPVPFLNVAVTTETSDTFGAYAGDLSDSDLMHGLPVTHFGAGMHPDVDMGCVNDGMLDDGDTNWLNDITYSNHGGDWGAIIDFGMAVDIGSVQTIAEIEPGNPTNRARQPFNLYVSPDTSGDNFVLVASVDLPDTGDVTSKVTIFDTLSSVLASNVRQIKFEVLEGGNGQIHFREWDVFAPAAGGPGGEVPEPTGLGLVGLVLLGLRKRRS